MDLKKVKTFKLNFRGIKMMIRVVRSWFCKHDFMHIKTNEYREGTVTTYMCKKCGWIRKIKTE